MLKRKEYSAEELKTFIRKLIRDDNIKKFYNIKAWKRLRKKILEDNNNECQHCKLKGKQSNGTEVHHIKTVREHPELALTYTNLVLLCEQCHYDIHHPKKENKWNDEKW